MGRGAARGVPDGRSCVGRGARRKACGNLWLLVGFAVLAGCGKSCFEFFPCTHTECGDSCVDTSSDPNNCGRCGNVCTGETPFCQNGQCAGCSSGLTLCGWGYCADLATDTANCGACGSNCFGGVCDAGVCACPQGATLCGGICQNLSVDSRNCGRCGNVCAGVCQHGQCQPCPSGLTGCNPGCFDLATEPHHCGKCGNDCGYNFWACESGICKCPGVICQSGEYCVNPLTDWNYCGASGDCTGSNAGVQCSFYQSCVKGHCQ